MGGQDAYQKIIPPASTSLPNHTMNYFILKNILDTTLANFRCQQCHSGITEKDINIVSTTSTGVNMEITCPECRASGIVRAEVNFLDQIAKGNDLTSEIRRVFGRVQGEGTIRDEDIVSLRESLKTCHSVADLFN